MMSVTPFLPVSPVWDCPSGCGKPVTEESVCYVISEGLSELHPQDLQGMLHSSLEVVLNENGPC